MKKEVKVYLILVVIVVAVVAAIMMIKTNPVVPATGNADEKTLKCIGKKSQLVVSPTCSICAYQKQILKENLENYEIYFNIIDITEHPEIMQQYAIEGAPTWIINGEKYEGFQSIETLKELTGC